MKELGGVVGRIRGLSVNRGLGGDDVLDAVDKWTHQFGRCLGAQKTHHGDDGVAVLRFGEQGGQRCDELVGIVGPVQKNKGVLRRCGHWFEATARADGFSLQFSAGRGLLTLREQRLPHGLVVNSLTMAIADIAFPFDISQGIGGLRHRRHQLHALEATLSFDDAHDWLARQVPGTNRHAASQMSIEPEGVAML